MTTNVVNLQTFLEEFYRVDTTKIIENVYHTKVKSKEEVEEYGESETPVYLYQGESVQVATDLNILNFPMEVGERS